MLSRMAPGLLNHLIDNWGQLEWVDLEQTRVYSVSTVELDQISLANQLISSKQSDEEEGGSERVSLAVRDCWVTSA